MNPALRIVRWLLVLLTMSSCLPSAPPPADPDCSTPRRAADSLFAWQTPPHYDLAKATACVDGPRDARRAAATQLKAVLDARGVWAPVHTLPDTRDADGQARVALTEEPPIWLARGADGRWRYDEDTMARVPQWHAETFSPIALALQERFPQLSATWGGLSAWQVVFGLAIALLSWLLSHLAQRLSTQRVLALARRVGVEVDPDEARKLDGPLGWSILFAVLAWGLPQLQLPITLSSWLTVLIGLSLRLSLVVLALRFVDLVALVGAQLASRTTSKLDDQLVPLLRSTGKTLAIAVGAFAVLQALGVDVWKLVAGASVGGIIIGLAAQDSMKNFFGSLNVFIDQPFQIGDWIIVGGVEGTVEEVGFRSTRIRTFYNSQVTVPNSTITNANVDNMGRRHRRRVRMTVSLTYDSPPDALQAWVEGARAILAAHPNVENTYEIHVFQLADSGIEILVYYHLIVPDWHGELVTRSQNLLELIRLTEALGLSFAFPSRSLYLAATPEHPLPPHPDRSIDELNAVAEDFGPRGTRARPHGPPFPGTYDAPNWARNLGVNAGRGSAE